MSKPKIYSTTILALKHNGKIAIAGDGQVTLDKTIVKGKARKVRKIYKDSILAGFAGATADAMTLFEKLESHLEEYKGNLERAAVELAKSWRTDRYLRRLEALLIAANHEKMLLLSGTGDVIEPDDDLVAIGSGAGYALAAARALVNNSSLDAEKIAFEALSIAASICIYTNDDITVLTL